MQEHTAELRDRLGFGLNIFIPVHGCDLIRA
jgi:hypothetical protein